MSVPPAGLTRGEAGEGPVTLKRRLLPIHPTIARLAQSIGGQTVQRVAIAGFGAIGKVVAEHLDRGIDGLGLAAVSARDAARAAAAMAGFARPVPVLPLARLWKEADIIVECAPAPLLRDIAEPALAAGRILVVLSCGALLDNFDLV